MSKHEAPTGWSTLLNEAVTKPGHAAECYRAFHNYSFGNQALAAFQCQLREIPIGPIATFKAWKAKDRMVMKGQRALILCVPVMVTREDDDGDKYQVCVGFTYKAMWFAVSQTDGPDCEPDPVPGWDMEQALRNLKVERINFGVVNGNVQGYAHKRTVALNPVAQHPMRTMVHEVAHVVLGHTDDETTVDEGRVPYNVGELEAEAVAYLVCDVFGLDGAAESRGYIQHWYKENTVDDETANRIYIAANKILNAGKEEQNG